MIEDEKFKTHIKEPRWQQAASIIVVVTVAGVWLWIVLHAR